ncbi:MULTISPECIES: hypothetical protein [Haloarcula]|uniref:hypothetical protein n=1 Tax=Haloarcula TaxID=2237 RepID=UPI0023EB086F|nr:hypothetical protein [Halomicroarcula sp. XH51]
MTSHAPTETTTPASTTANWDEASPEELLPTPGNGWEQTSTEEAAFSNLGFREGVQAEYTDTDDLRVRVLIVVPIVNSPSEQAQYFAGDGWQVALGFNKFAIAASTGTKQRTATTPETPVGMDTTPIPDTKSDIEALLARSPALSLSHIREHDVGPS